MKINVGCIDSFLRIMLGVWMIYFALHSDIAWWGYFGVYPLVTGMGRMSPLYFLLGFSTDHSDANTGVKAH
jgi:hypothetical protein